MLGELAQLTTDIIERRHWTKKIQSECLGAFLRFLEEDDWVIRKATIEALASTGKRGPPKAGKVIKLFWEEYNEEVRAAAARYLEVLAGMGHEGTRHSAAVVELLQEEAGEDARAAALKFFKIQDIQVEEARGAVTICSAPTGRASNTLKGHMKVKRDGYDPMWYDSKEWQAEWYIPPPNHGRKDVERTPTKNKKEQRGKQGAEERQL
eukprot:gnl/MRDRNA2_/MRDRNA2_149503_c0_seq1.p1 gnl/MRDRNA2_/MRDRNA2_149503_c0~~gnl/MRDRNA2_/MRDRNA2_149503_c0_seq1.p1  ORF type:complete len:208 (-),score=48.00 gnl/MRDRNA2_/MRDRNA2_149503_c0_seq1:104-727(-)